jgi:hypothetical protein
MSWLMPLVLSRYCFSVIAVIALKRIPKWIEKQITKAYPDHAMFLADMEL